MACAKLNVGNDGVQTSRVIYVLKRILSESFAEGWRSTAEQACGIVANFCYESTYCDPSAYRPNDNGGPSGGLMQWHERFSEAGFFSEMKNWVGQRNGGGWKSLPLQVDFFLKADTPQMKAERATWKKYCDENPGLSAESYAFAFMDKIERPAASERTETSESTKKRKGTASTLYEWLGSSDINSCDVSDIGKVAPSVIVMNGNSSASVRSRESMTAEEWEEFCRKCMEMKTNASLDANVRAAIMFLARKGFGKSGKAAGLRPTGFFDGWPDALRRYNARRDRTADGRYYSDAYASKILSRAKDPDAFVPIEIKLAK